VRDLSALIKAYDVRGVVPEQWGPELAQQVGTAFVEVLGIRRVDGGEGQIVVGHDMRPTGPDLVAAFINGVTEAGVDVTAQLYTGAALSSSGSININERIITPTKAKAINILDDFLTGEEIGRIDDDELKQRENCNRITFYNADGVRNTSYTSSNWFSVFAMNKASPNLLSESVASKRVTIIRKTDAFFSSRAFQNKRDTDKQPLQQKSNDSKAITCFVFAPQ
jgi:hypothetical protein